MERKMFARPPKFKNRMLMMLTGVCLQGLGLSLLIRLNFGTDPCSSLTQGVISHISLSFGTAQVLCHLINFLIVIWFDRSKIGFGTIGNMCLLGYLSDFFGWIWDGVLPSWIFESLPSRIVLLIPALCAFILGAATYMTAGLGTSPYDGVPYIISAHVSRVPFKIVRMVWDICFMIAGFLLGGDVGIITIAVAFFLGPVITWTGKKMERWLV